MSTDKIRVLVVDDSQVSRDIMKHFLGSNPNIEVIGTAQDGIEALDFIKKHRPDMVFTDIVMPRMDGFQLTQEIMKSHPLPVVAVSGVYNREEIAKGFQLIDAGAITILEKPKGLEDSNFLSAAQFILDAIKIINQVRTHQPSTLSSVEEPLTKKINLSNRSLKNIHAVGIGAAIGGPKALQKILSALPSNLAAPVLVVQHIVPGFVEGFADWLSKNTKLKVSIARQGERAMPGTVYIAPDKNHMELMPGNIISLTPDYSQSPYVPSVGKLFRSIANAHGSNCLGLMLLGADKDGAKDLHYMNEAGALTIYETGINLKKYNDLPKNELPHASFEEIASTLETIFSQKV